jgi:pilus assembly protein CpaF
MVNLSLTEKGGSTNELSFDKDEVTVGRVRGNDIVLPKGNVSKHHCRFLIQGDEVVVEDLHSTNGTYVNGRKIAEPTAVGTTDKVFVGDFIIRLNLLSTTMEVMRPNLQPGPPEAGSLSSAIPRRPPPPPPAARPSAIMDAVIPGAPKTTHGAQAPMTAPPPLAPKRETKAMPAMDEPFPPPSGPSDIDLDDEDDALGTPHPHIPVPPLRPAVQPAGSLIDLETPQGAGEDDLAGLPPPPTDLGADEMAPPPPPSGAYDALGEPAEDVPTRAPAPFLAVGTEKPSPAHRQAADRAPEPAKAHEQPKGKSAPQPVAKAGGRPLDRDVPDWLARLIEGDGVSAAFLMGTGQPEVLRNGRRESVSVSSSDLAGLNAAIRKLAAKGSPRPAPDAAVINTTLPDGMHISAIFPPVADRLCVAVRRPVASGKTIDDLVAEKVISAQMRQVLEACVATRQNILVSGDRGACDSLLRAILWSVDRVARVVLLSDSITPPASATAWIRLQADSQAPDLVAAAVAMQPDYLVVDANHMAHLSDVLSECGLGLEGVVLSMVARSTNEALHRIQLLGAPAGSSGAASGDQVLSSIDVVVQASILTEGSLKVVEIAEPKASLDGQVTSHALLTWIPDKDGAGTFTVTGARSALASKLSSAGSGVPAEILTP